MTSSKTMIVSVTIGRIYDFFPSVTAVLDPGLVSPSTVVMLSLIHI